MSMFLSFKSVYFTEQFSSDPDDGYIDIYYDTNEYTIVTTNIDPKEVSSFSPSFLIKDIDLLKVAMKNGDHLYIISSLEDFKKKVDTFLVNSSLNIFKSN